MSGPVTPIFAALRSPWDDCAVSSGIAAAVVPHLDRGVWVVEGVEITDLFTVWDHAPLVVLVGVAEHGIVGDLHRVELLGDSTERTGTPAQIITLARALDRAPDRAILITIGVGAHGGDCHSPLVTAAVGPAGRAVVAEFARLAS